jgi:hypothetical protein
LPGWHSALLGKLLLGFSPKPRQPNAVAEPVWQRRRHATRAQLYCCTVGPSVRFHRYLVALAVIPFSGPSTCTHTPPGDMSVRSGIASIQAQNLPPRSAPRTHFPFPRCGPAFSRDSQLTGLGEHPENLRHWLHSLSTAPAASFRSRYRNCPAGRCADTKALRRRVLPITANDFRGIVPREGIDHAVPFSYNY